MNLMEENQTTQIDQQEETKAPVEQTPKGQEKENTFTQEDVNRFLARERKKWEKEQQKAQMPVAEPAPNPELERVTEELQTARAQLEAFRLDIRPDMVEDAVYLAIRDVGKDGEPDGKSMRDALTAILKRHPDWKKDAQQTGGIKVGMVADQDAPQKGQALPAGRVIF